MTENSRYCLKNYSLHLPALWEKDWEKSCSNASQPEKSILEAMGRSCSLLKVAAGKPAEATPERLAWLALWTRTFTILDATMAALSRPNTLLLPVLSRMASECFLHIRAISTPNRHLRNLLEKWGQSPSAKPHRANPATVLQRLQAYAAWCLYSDFLFYREFTHGRIQQQIWDPRYAEELNKAFEEHPWLEQLITRPDPEKMETNRAKLAQGKREMQEVAQMNIARCKAWLSEPSMKPWFEKLEAWRNRFPQPLSFMALVTNDNPGFREQAAQQGLEIMHLEQKHASKLLHGSGFDSILYISKDNSIFPYFFDWKKEAAQHAASIEHLCSWMLFELFGFIDLAWKVRAQEDRN